MTPPVHFPAVCQPGAPRLFKQAWGVSDIRAQNSHCDPRAGVGRFHGPVQTLVQKVARSQMAIYTVDQSEKGAGDDPAGLARQTLEMFSALTGGRWYTSDRTDEAIARAMADARGSYRLAYDSLVRENGRKEHKIRLDSVRKGVHLLSRDSYFGDEPDPGADQSAEAVLNRQSHCPFDATEIALRVAMSASGRPPHSFRHPRRSGGHPHQSPRRAFPRRPERDACPLQQRYFSGCIASHPKGRQPHPGKLDSASKDGILIPQDVTIHNQIQQVRVMVFDRALHRMGSVTIPIR